MEDQTPFAPYAVPTPKAAPMPPMEMLSSGGQRVIVVDKTTHRLIYEEETEEKLVIRIEPK